MILVTAAETLAEPDSRAARKRANACAKSGWRQSSLSGMDGLAESFDPGIDLGRARLERGAVDDEPRRHPGDHVDLAQTVGFERLAGAHQIDDVLRQA